MTSINKEEVSKELIEMASEFSTKFQKWMEKHDCRATFQWRYGSDRSVKSLEVESIDLLVFRRPPPSFENIKQVLDKAQSEVEVKP